MKRYKHSNVAIFVPHNGCPHCCSFCNQIRITGKQSQPTRDDVISAVEIAMNSKGYSPQYSEIAFFGGSFTAIERDYMMLLLETAYSYVKNKKFYGIRISTRPDCIDNEILNILKKYGVTSIELGAQSMCDDVLNENIRGHSSDDIINASKLIKEYSFEFGLQMMTGLYKSTIEKDIYTAEKICSLKPKTVRIYPTIIMKDTLLGDYFSAGKYKSYTLEETVELCAKLLVMFEKNNIQVIRLGLHNTEDVQKGMLSGAWHPSFGELCFSRVYRNKIEQYIISQKLDPSNYVVMVNKRDISKVLGQHKGNVEYFNKKGYNLKFTCGDVEIGKFIIS